ncbi:MurR/RpiR family transcriptional regulator [Frondihabitans australicus]|uniref:RpiR family transcriptional regulator n=1 Tax=Frondihabitans australicus TaxID=386892 RepID=A0A495IL47_9MICO|nr:MurR/RpiR family transcriptional regulator [Frondihabitans australicus]RKR76001.1 RpiR family transcriptional regulator [Frondihabitans australicus]
MSDSGPEDASVADASPLTGAGIRVRIDANYVALTRQEQRAADFILDHLDDLAVYSATEIASSSGVSKATVSRLFRRLGFADAQEVREHARELRSRGIPVGAPADLAAHAATEHAALDRMLAGLADGRLDEAVRLLAGAARVVVLGFRNSYPVALHLSNQLTQARPDVRLAPAPGQSVGQELAGLGPADAVLLVAFRRRPSGVGLVLDALATRGVPTVLVSDPAFRPALGAGVHLTCPVEATGAFDSYAAAMSLAQLIAVRVLALGGGAGRARVADVTALYGELGELE